MSLPAGAATFTVTTLNDSGAGSLRDAIGQANATLGPDTIAFQAGLTGTITLTSGEILISDPLTINGPGAGVLALSGNNASRIFYLSNANGSDAMAGKVLTINGLTLRDGKTSGDGGAIGSNGAGASLLTLNNCVLTGNSARSGGAIYKNGGSVTVTNSTLTANAANNSGGAIQDFNGTVTVNNSTLTYNTALTGGGIYHNGNTMVVTNSTVFSNTATTGGGIYATSVDLMRVRNSTVSGNTASNGGGIWFGGVWNSDSTLANSIVAGNFATNGSNIYRNSNSTTQYLLTSLGHNLLGENGVDGLVNITRAVSDLVLAGAINTALGSLASNGGPTQTLMPVAVSPVIDAGDNTLIPAGATTDQRGTGYARIVGGTVDIGAVEGFTPPSTTGGLSFSVLNNASRTITYACGLNSVGQLGAGLVTPSSTASVRPQAFVGRSVYPVRVRFTRATRAVTATTAAPLATTDTTNFIAIASGAAHTIALHSDGSVWAWGDNANGQLGNGATTAAGEPTPVLINSSGTPLTGVIAIAAGRHHSVAVKNDGTVWSWGSNQYGQLGDNSDAATTRLYPVQVVIDAAQTPLTDVRLVAASDVHTVAMKTDGMVWAWGDNARGELGTGDTTAHRTAVQVLVLDDVQAILARGNASTARNLVQRSDGTLWGWGDNSACQLGDTTAALGNPVLTPVALANLNALGVGASNLAQGEAHGLARKPDGTVWAWGANGQGQLGDGTTTQRCAPIQVGGVSDVETVGAGVDHSFATTGDGSVLGWGNNNEGQLCVGDTTARPAPTPMKDESGTGTLNLKTDVPPTTTYLLTLTTAGTGTGTVSGAGSYAAGVTVTLTATPNTGSTFAGWSPSPCAASFPMPANALTCTATFTLSTQGDVNGDGKVDALDVVATINAVLGLSSSSAADVNGDGAVNALDVVFVINKVLGL